MGVIVDNIGAVTYGPTAQGDAYAAVASLDARGYASVSFTLKATVQTLAWTVFAANLSDFSDEVIVQAEAAVAAGAIGTFAVGQAPYGFYRVKTKNNAAGVVGTALVTGYAKP